MEAQQPQGSPEQHPQCCTDEEVTTLRARLDSALAGEVAAQEAWAKIVKAAEVARARRAKAATPEARHLATLARRARFLHERLGMPIDEGCSWRTPAEWELDALIWVIDELTRHYGIDHPTLTSAEYRGEAR